MFVASAGCGRPEGSEAKTGRLPERAPNFELKDLSGKTVRLSDFQGKVTLLDFWATYCLPCHESIPAFQRMYERYRADGLEVVGISVDAYAEHVPEFVKERGMAYTVLLDSDETAMEAYGIRGLPETFLIDRDGRLRDHWVGFDGQLEEEIRAAVRASLRGKDAS
ncbi:MAG: TlpA disulfide reductase family protein [Elusimicrobiota bacterium]